MEDDSLPLMTAEVKWNKQGRRLFPSKDEQNNGQIEPNAERQQEANAINVSDLSSFWQDKREGRERAEKGGERKCGLLLWILCKQAGFNIECQDRGKFCICGAAIS